MSILAHFHNDHNRALNKHSLRFCFVTFVCCFFTQLSFNAWSLSDAITLNNDSSAKLISPQFAVYKQDRRALSFEEFTRARDFLPYQQSKQSNYGIQPHGVWLYAQMQNTSDIEDWVLSIRFSQLQDVQLFLVRNGKLAYQQTDGIQNKTTSYALPSFNLQLNQNETVEVYIYLRSSTMNLVAPIYMQDREAYLKLAFLDYSVWGLMYGLILILTIFGAAFLFYNRHVATVVYLASLFNLTVFQILWSGHSVHLPEWVTHSFVYLRAESVVLLSMVIASVFTLIIIPYRLQHKTLRYYLSINTGLSLLFAFVFLGTLLNLELKILITYIIAFGGMLVNILMGIFAYRQAFFPARPLIVGWCLTLLGSIASALFTFGILPNNPFHQQLFYASLIAQAVTFLLSIVLKKQYDLELEVQEAQNDAENNFSLIEEQNVHLDLARKEAIKASEVKSQFLANMSHEIRTPLHAIIGFSKEMELKQNLPEREEHIRIINSAASDLLTIVNDVLDFSKMEAGKLSLNNKPFSPRDLLEDVAALMSKSAHLKQLEFVLDINVLPSFLIGDAVKVKQLLSNLLSNALKFTNYGHIMLKALVIEQDDHQCVIEFQVEDSGIGISEKGINKLFTAFHQLDDELNRSFQGTGLGLVICQELTSLMNGQITVTSIPTKGSVFAAKIPFLIDHNATQLKPIESFKNQQAILVDEWGLSRKTSQQQLALTGFEVTALSSIDELEALYINNQYVFVSMPYRLNEKRLALIERLSYMVITNLVLLYSGPVPNTQIFDRVNNTPQVMRLPLSTRKIIDLNQAPSSPSMDKTDSVLSALPRIRMLAVDDMELNLRLLSTWLKTSPIILDVAYSGAQAISLCQQHDYDIILMDIQMPNMDGLTATSQIRKTELNIGTPIVAVTAHALESERQHFLDSGMDDFLSKPINLDALAEIITTWCVQLPEDLRQLPDTIDWGLMLSRSNNNKADAISFFDKFIDDLQQHTQDIEAGWQQQRKDLVLASIHKLHGVCCYTGVPRLQNYCKEAQELIKLQALEQHSKIISTLLLEIEQVCAQWPQLKNNLG